MQRPNDRLAAGLRAAVTGLAWLTPPVLLGLVLEALLGGTWLVYLTLLLGGVAVGALIERARAAERDTPPARQRGQGGPSSGPHAGEAEDDHSSQKYLM